MKKLSRQVINCIFIMFFISDNHYQCLKASQKIKVKLKSKSIKGEGRSKAKNTDFNSKSQIHTKSGSYIFLGGFVLNVWLDFCDLSLNEFLKWKKFQKFLTFLLFTYKKESWKLNIVSINWNHSKLPPLVWQFKIKLKLNYGIQLKMSLYNS